MPVLTDPRQIVSPLPACLMKEIPDETVSTSRASAAKRSEATERKLQLGRGGAPKRILEAEAGKQPATSTEAIAPPPGREIRDPLWRHKVLVECWSLNASKEFHGELPSQSAATKELCQQEAILWAARERDRDKWMAFSESERAEQVGIVGKSNSMQPEQFARTRPRSGDTETKWSCCEFTGSGTPGGMDNAAAERSENRQRVFGEHDGQEPNHGRILNGFWESAEWLWCRDQKYRPVEAGTFPLAHGIANRVGKLRGYGNALVAPQAEGFIRAYMEILHA